MCCQVVHHLDVDLVWIQKLVANAWLRATVQRQAADKIEDNRRYVYNAQKSQYYLDRTNDFDGLFLGIQFY